MDSIGEELERLAALRSKGDLSEEEYEELKKNLIDGTNSSVGENPKSKKAFLVVGLILAIAAVGIILGVSLGDSDSGSPMEEAWIELEVEKFNELGIADVTQKEAECSLRGFVDDVGFNDAKAQFGDDNASPEIMRSFFASLIDCSNVERILANEFFNDSEMQGLPTEFVQCSVELLAGDSTLLLDLMMEEMSNENLDEEMLRSFFSSLNECIDIGSILAREFLEDPEMNSMPTELLDCTIRLIEKDSELVIELMMMGALERDASTVMNPLLPDLLICLSESLSSEEIDEIFGSENSNIESEQSEEKWPSKIVFGFVPSQEQERLQDDIKPMMEYLTENLGIKVEGIVTTDFVGLGVAMGTGEADLGAFGPAGFVMAEKQFGNIQVMGQAIRYGAPSYHGQWMTNDASICNPGTLKSGTALINTDYGIEQVTAIEAIALQVGVSFGDSGKELAETVDAGSVSPGMSCMADISNVIGRTVAFTNESSTSGYQYPTLQLRNAGIDDDQYGKVFSGGHDGAVAAVYNGDADFGVAYDDARRTMRKTNTDVGEKVIVFNLTAEIPNDVIAVRTDLPDSLKGAIYYSMDAYLKTEQGAEVSDEVFGWTDMQVARNSDFDIVREASMNLGVYD